MPIDHSPPKNIPHSNTHIPENLISSTSAPWQQNILAMLLDMIPQMDRNLCLDLSSGVGKNIPTLRKSGIQHIMAADISEAALEFSSQINPADEYLCADAHDVPLPSARFDIVICTEAIEHYRNPLKAYEQIWRLAKPNGYIILSGQNHFNLTGIYKLVVEFLCLKKNWDAWGTHNEGFENFITSFHMRQMLIQSNVRIIRDIGADYLNAWMFFLPGIYRNYQILDRYPLLALGKLPLVKHIGMDYFVLGQKNADNISP